MKNINYYTVCTLLSILLLIDIIHVVIMHVGQLILAAKKTRTPVEVMFIHENNTINKWCGHHASGYSVATCLGHC